MHYRGLYFLCQQSRLCSSSTGNGGSRSTWFGKLKTLPAFAGLTAISVLLATFAQRYQPGKEIIQDVWAVFPHKLEESRLERKVALDFVSRPELEKKLEANITKGLYCIVYGDKGVGKSAAVNDMFWDKPGVVAIKVSHLTKSDELVARLALKVLGPSGTPVSVQEEDLVSALESTAMPITIIFEVERGKEDQQRSTVGAVRSLAKSLAPYARCVIVVSEANAVLEFGDDKNRENYVYVDEMTREEAKQLLLKKGARFSEDELQFIFDSIGTSPSRLIKLVMCVPGESLQDYVAHILADAKRDLIGFPLQSLLRELKKQSAGVSVEMLEGKTDANEKHVKLDSRGSVGPFLKNTGNPVVYRLELGTYQLLSTPHRVALNSHKPKL